MAKNKLKKFVIRDYGESVYYMPITIKAETAEEMDSDFLKKEFGIYSVEADIMNYSIEEIHER